MINVRVYRVSDSKFLEDFSVGNYIGNHNEINRHVKRMKFIFIDFDWNGIFLLY
jgi:hypothetical protein